MIQVNQLSKKYGDRLAVDELDFQVKKGEVVGFLGPNGAGKTTTMKMITGFMAPTKGHVTVGGWDVFQNPMQVKTMIGYLPDAPPVYGDMKVTSFLRFVAEIKGVPAKECRRAVEEAISKTQLGAVENRYIQNLSKGFRQRVGLAQAIVSRPEVLILDEPTVGLDPKQVAEVRNLLHELKGQHTIILSTHILSEVEASCEKVVIINHGKIVIQDMLSSIYQKFSDEFLVNLKIKRPSTAFNEGLVKLTGVHELQEKPGVGLQLKVEGSDQALEEISKYVVDKGAGLLSFEPHQKKLEDIFIELTGEQFEQGEEDENSGYI